MKIADYILLAAVAVCFTAALLYTLRRRKNGGCMGCGAAGDRSSQGPKDGHTGCDACGSCSGCIYASKGGCPH